ncbi:polyadenylate-binding protein-interacting protein 4 isoform X1 [Vitis riparia]|uniref:polyadenylate-binding protein-interacting protein 4 isoform X1 n=1 Tax=Vitis riparia TaxID=96939 RepID=UPI00155AE607|nr:polyadenylate-binding protein-interacting protein 4 isoform X1 [Vitis riparia]XP_034696868.1 polyadenylate-binding protein-interacting protein 4 isoform X1 [Vitis riparia]XP_034696869.1 polyadenylate-binding protein-interacting protein 4 isoform X1 [Vitis riparia]
MNLQQVAQPRPFANGFGRRREMGSRQDNKLQSGKSNPSRLPNAGVFTGTKGGGYESSSRDRLVYLTTCFIGLPVEVQVKNGSIISGIFHATNADKDFGIVLKMARLTKDGPVRGQKAISDSVSKAPSKILIIPAKELVQVIAKDVSVTRDGFSNELQQDKLQDIMLDSIISQSRHIEMERELERWVPDEDIPQCPELEKTFDGPWKRGWDQFEINKKLFGVNSTFDEEIYTTKLDRGPQTRELEKEALRLAREIEGEETHDLHLAEERGLHLHANFDIDEEARFSSVLRRVDIGEDNEDGMLDSHNDETFGGSSGLAIGRHFADLTTGKSNDVAQVSSSSSSVDEAQSSQSGTGLDLYHSGSHDHARHLALDSQSRVQENQFSEQQVGNNHAKEFVEKQTLAEEAQTSKSEDLQSLLDAKKDGSDKGGLSPNATAYAPSHGSSKSQENMGSPAEVSEGPVSVRTMGETQSVNSRGRPSSSTSSASDCVGATPASIGPGLSPSSSVGSLSSEKSTLNPHAKEFKLNPNAKSFIPSQTPVRPPSPVSDGSFYFPTNVPAIPHMHVPVGVGIGHSFSGHQPVIFNPQAAPIQSPQTYFHPNGPQYGQQMFFGHPRQVLYMPGYPPEMPYKGRDF